MAANLRRPCTHPRCAALRMVSTAHLQAAVAASASRDTCNTVSCRTISSAARARAVQSEHNRQNFNQRILKRPRPASHRPNNNHNHARQTPPLSEAGLHREGLATVFRLLRCRVHFMIYCSATAAAYEMLEEQTLWLHVEHRTDQSALPLYDRFSEKQRETARQQYVSDEQWAEGCTSVHQQVKTVCYKLCTYTFTKLFVQWPFTHMCHKIDSGCSIIAL
jgi:hypothetical protein